MIGMGNQILQLTKKKGLKGVSVGVLQKDAETSNQIPLL